MLVFLGFLIQLTQPQLPPCTVPDAPTLDVVAHIIEGETPPALMGEEAATALAWTLRNRCQATPTQTIQVVGQAYYGRETPSPQAQAIAERVWLADPGDDPLDGRVTALSLQNVRERFNCTPDDDPKLDALIWESPINPRTYQLWIPRHFPTTVCTAPASAPTQPTQPIQPPKGEIRQ